MCYNIIEKDRYEDLPYVKTLSFGCGKNYLITKGDIPYIRLEIGTDNPFDTACIFRDYLCIGAYDKVIFVDLDTLESHSMNIEMYFGYFDILNEWLFVSSGVGITALDENLNVVWQRNDLAVDGVIINRVTEDKKYLEVSCELDPPGDWHTKWIDIHTGEETERERYNGTV